MGKPTAKVKRCNVQDLQSQILAHFAPVIPRIAPVHAAPHFLYDPCGSIDVEAALRLEALEQG